MPPRYSVRSTSPLPFAAGLTAILSTTSTLAQVRFEAPLGCGTQASFEAAIRAHLGEGAAPLLAQTHINIAASDNGFTLFAGVGQESRTLEDANCADLYNASVVVAIALWNAPQQRQPNAETPRPIDAIVPKTIAEIPPQVPPKASRFATNRPKPPIRQQLLVGAQLGIASGLLPKVGPSVGLRVAYELGAVGLAATARLFPTTSQRDATDHGVSVDGIGARVGVYLKPLDSLGIEGGMSLTRLHGAGLGSASNGEASLVWLGPHVGLWTLPFEYQGIYTQIGAELELAILQPRFVIDGYDEVFRTGRVNLQGSLGAGYRF